MTDSETENISKEKIMAHLSQISQSAENLLLIQSERKHNRRNQFIQFASIEMKRNFELFEKCEFSIKKYLNELQKPTGILDHTKDIEPLLQNIFIMLLSFFYERYLYEKYQGNLYSEKFDLMKEILKNKDIFDEADRIQEIINEMPFIIYRSTLESDSYKKIHKEIIEAQKSLDQWNTDFDSKKEKVETLGKTLKAYENQFNFVGLSQGFLNIYEEKKKEKCWSLVFVILLGAIVIGVAILAIIWTAGVSIKSTDSLSLFIKIIPTLGLELLLVYFFRLAYTEHKSIKSQILQIRLRMSLCQFIQSYASYAKELSKSKASMKKFEDIIFSGIVSDPNNVPATFDGVDQIGTLIGKIRGIKS